MRVFPVVFGLCIATSGIVSQGAVARPVLVELFTSEGCSSCPPADTLLAEVARQRNDVIVLSEHVTYWDYLGWRDPYSLDEATDRQGAYAGALHLRGPYTPQMVVNGHTEFVGSDRGAMQRALEGPRAADSTELRLALKAPGSGHMSVTIDVKQAPPGSRVMAVLALKDGRQSVARGENSGRTLAHVNVARVFKTMGTVGSDGRFSGDADFTLPDAQTYRVIAFVQQGRGGKVLGVAAS